MTDAIAVLPPGFRLLDNSGNEISGGTIEFYDAGTTTPRTVYSDSGLSVSLGTIVYTNSSGTPVAASGSSTAVIVYTGSTAYKVIIKDGSGSTLVTLDNIRGALDTSTFLTSTSTSTLSVPVVATSAGTRAVTVADNGKLICANTSGGSITHTLAAAATLGAGWNCKFKKVAAANTYTIARTGAETIDGVAASATLSELNQEIELYCDGVNFFIGANAYEFATNAESITGSKTNVMVAPSNLAAVIAGFTATKANMEAASSTVLFATAGRTQNHPGVAKCWGAFTFTGVNNASYNITSIIDAATGIVDVTIGTDFSDANWAAIPTVYINTGLFANIRSDSAQTTGTVRLGSWNTTDTSAAADGTAMYFNGHGTQ